jgi:hypothetical protein
MENLKIVSILLLPYFIICGGLYHMAFWGTFDINGLEYIGISEIVKSFVYPFLSTTFVLIIGSLIQEYAWIEVFPHGGGTNSSLGKKLNSKAGITIGLIMWSALSIITYKTADSFSWFSWAVIFASVPYLMLDRFGVFQNLFQNQKIRLQLIKFLVFVPALSFAAGKYQGELIQKNKKYKYIVTKNHSIDPGILKADTFKLIGMSDKHIFMTDLKNSFILILRSDKVDTLILKQH